jgi:hypothetical protein
VPDEGVNDRDPPVTRRQRFDATSLALADILQAWDVLGVYHAAGSRTKDDEEYDDLVDPLRTWLEAGAGPAELSARLVRTLCDEYGLEYPDESGEIEFTQRLYAWWSAR